MARWGWDPLSLAADVAQYWSTREDPPSVIAFEFHVGRHPCDDEPYIGDVSLLTGDQFDGDDDAG